VPGSAVTAAPLLWLLAIAAAGLITGLAGLRRRDVV
jgi:putative exporter of polyketide antibiotics